MQMENDALSLEYKLKNGVARGHLSLRDIVGDPLVLDRLGIPDHGFEDRFFDLGLPDVRQGDDAGRPFWASSW